MDKDGFLIREAVIEDAPQIAEAIMMAIGEELVEGIANGHGRAAVKRVFTQLAEMPDTQYSYRNAFVAEDASGHTCGIVVAYDGSILLRARRHFFALAKEVLEWDIRDIAPGGEPDVETDSSEFYLDSLGVWPQFRGRGIATSLVEVVARKAQKHAKPVGLLCALHNAKARSLYEYLGFRQIGCRNFAGEEMAHMQRVN